MTASWREQANTMETTHGIQSEFHGNIYICTYTLFYIMYNIIQNVHMFISWNTIIHMYYIYVSICTIMLCYVIISYYHLIGTHTYICYYMLLYIVVFTYGDAQWFSINGDTTGFFLMGYIIILYQKRLLPALKSPIVCVDSLFFVDILHYLMFFCCPFRSLFYQKYDRLVVGAQKAICFPKYIT